jgi:glycosyltransferase involved in cell wall biosynthesis
LDRFFLRTPVDRFGENWAKLWFEQATFPRFCRRERAAVAHVPYWGSPLRSGVPTVVTIHDLIPLMFSLYRGNLLVRAYSALVSRSARRAAHIVTDSEASRQDIIDILKVPPDRVGVVYLAADESFRPVADRSVLEGMRAKYHLPERYLLYLGGFDARKNVSFLLQAYAQLVKEWPQAPRLVIAGRLPEESSEFFPAPHVWIDRLDLGDRVLLIGWVDEEDKPALYSAADVFVFPSDYEGFGLPVLEAISCGTPAVVTEAGSLPEIVGEGGLRVQVGNLMGLTQAMARVVREADLRESLRRQALAHAAQFTWDHAAAQMAAIYDLAARRR